MEKKELFNVKRLITTTVLSLLLVILLLPLCSHNLVQGIYESCHTNGSIRMDICMPEYKDISIKILSKNKTRITGKDDTVKGVVVEDEIKHKWRDYKICVQALHDGDLEICLRGPDRREGTERYPVIVDYRDLKINGGTIFDGTRNIWHDTPLRHKLNIKDKDVVEITFSARKHYFQIGDVIEYYQLNIWILSSLFIVSFLIAYRLVGYVTGFRILGQQSGLNIVFVSLFFISLIVPISKINTANISDQENRTLAKKPEFYNKTGINSKYGADVEKWFNDRFLGRTLAIKLDTTLKFNLNRVYKKGGALYLSANNWMFGEGRLRTPDQPEASECLKQLIRFNLFCKQNNIKLYVLFVPYKGSIYHDILKKEYVYKIEDDNRFSQYIDELRHKSQIPIIYPYNELRSARHDDFVFFKQSHHWTDWGAYSGYVALMKEITRDFPDIKTVSLSEYNKFTSKMIRDEYDRDNFNVGITNKSLGFEPKFAEKYLLRDNYIYYDHKSGNDLMVNRKTFMKFYKQNTAEGYRILLVGNSQNEILLNYLPHSARELKYIRLNNGQLSEKEIPKVVKHYKNEILDFKPDILVYCVSANSLAYFTLNLTTN